MEEILVGRHYKHFKGGVYLVEAIAKNCDSEEDFVVYRSHSGQLWIRPAKQWLEVIERDERRVQRFVLMGE